MATALPISLSAPSGATLYAGRYGAGLFGGLTLDDLSPSGALTVIGTDLSGTILLDALAPTGTLRGTPSWRAAMVPNTWALVPMANTLASVDPAQNPALNPAYPGVAPWRGNIGHSGVLDAWNSFVASMTPGDARIWLTCAGGHADYAGNEHYELDLWAEAPAWVMSRRPSGALPDAAVNYSDGQEASGFYSDGRIRSSHVYQTQVHVPGRGIFMSDGAANYAAGNGSCQRAFWITEAGEHILACDYSALPLSGDRGTCCYDSLRDVLWFVRANGSSRIAKYDPNTGSVTAHGTTNSWVGGDSKMHYLPEHDLVVSLTGVVNGMVLWGPAAETWKRVVTLNGTKPSWFNGIYGSAGSAWIPELGQLLLWNNDAGHTAKFATLTPGADAWADAWTWGELLPDPSNSVDPPPKPGGGSGIANVLGKCCYVPALRGFFLQTQYSAAPYFYALF